jgi:hypothetical protein
MTLIAVQEQLRELLQEQARGKAELVQVCQRVVYLERTLERIQGGIFALEEVLRRDEAGARQLAERMRTPNGQAAATPSCVLMP